MGDLIEGDFGHGTGSLPGERISEANPIANAWQHLGSIGYGRIRRCTVIGGAFLEIAKQVSFELRHPDMAPVETTLRRNLLVGQFEEQHGIQLDPAHQAMYERATEALPNGPRG